MFYRSSEKATGSIDGAHTHTTKRNDNMGIARESRANPTYCRSRFVHKIRWTFDYSATHKWMDDKARTRLGNIALYNNNKPYINNSHFTNGSGKNNGHFPGQSGEIKTHKSLCQLVWTELYVRLSGSWMKLKGISTCIRHNHHNMSAIRNEFVHGIPSNFQCA